MKLKVLHYGDSGLPSYRWPHADWPFEVQEVDDAVTISAPYHEMTVAEYNTHRAGLQSIYDAWRESMVERRFFRNVAALTVVRDEYTVPNGKTLVLEKYVLNGAGTTFDATARLIWDRGGSQEELLGISHGDVSVENLSQSFVGDGTRKMTIELDNDASSQMSLGGYWRGTEYGE